MSKKEKRAELIRQATEAAERAFDANFDWGYHVGQRGTNGPSADAATQGPVEFRTTMDKLLELST